MPTPWAGLTAIADERDDRLHAATTRRIRLVAIAHADHTRDELHAHDVRPCLDRRANARSGHAVVLVAPATRTVRGIPTEVLLGPDDGVLEACALSFEHLTTVLKALLAERITRLAPAKLSELCPAFNVAAGC